MKSEEQGKTVLVTGATGFIGSFLCPRLMREGYEVTVLVRDEKKAAPLKSMGMHVLIGDLTKPETIEGVCSGIGTVIHLAAHVKNWGTKKTFYDSIFQGTKNLLNEAAKNQCRFIYFSSFCATGAASTKQHLAGFKEDDPGPKKIIGASLYADAKYDAEKLVLKYHHERRVDATIIRPANVIGPRSLWVTEIIKALNKGPVFPVIDNGRYNGSFVNIENLLDGVILVMTNDVSKGKTYHFRDDYTATWKEYLTELGAFLSSDVRIISIPFNFIWFLGYLNDKLLRPLNVKATISRHIVGLMGRDNSVDSSKAKIELGWKTSVSYRESMDMIGSWVKNEYLRKGV